MNGGRTVLVNVSSEWNVLLQGRGKNNAIGSVRQYCGGDGEARELLRRARTGSREPISMEGHLLGGW